MGIKLEKISLLSEDGSSLVAVLIIITVIFFLIGSVMTGITIQSRFIQQDVDELQLRYSAEAGIHHFLSDSTLSVPPKIDSLQVLLMDSTTASIKAEPFGGYLAVTSTVSSDNQSKAIRSLVGNQMTSSFRNAVILGDMHSALNLTGNTQIKGDISTGPLGIKENSFKGKRFEGTVDGNIKSSESEVLPEFDKTLFNREIAYCDSLLKNPSLEATRIDPGKVNLSEKNVFKNDSTFFVEGDLEITADSTVHLSEVFTLVVTGHLTLDGHIRYKPFARFVAGKEIKISRGLRGQHGLFYADRELTIENEEPFSGQFIAGQKATISGSSYLKYPSVVYLSGNEEQGIRNGRLELSDQAIVNGTLIIPPPDEMIRDDESRLVIGKGATARGAIFNTGQTELHGKVLGSVLTLQFYFYESPTSYINWLKDVEINIEERPENFTVPLGFSENREFEILAWQER